MGERARNIGVSRPWSVIVGRRMFVRRILWTGKQPLDGWRRSRSDQAVAGRPNEINAVHLGSGLALFA